MFYVLKDLDHDTIRQGAAWEEIGDLETITGYSFAYVFQHFLRALGENDDVVIVPVNDLNSPVSLEDMEMGWAEAWSKLYQGMYDSQRLVVDHQVRKLEKAIATLSAAALDNEMQEIVDYLSVYSWDNPLGFPTVEPVEDVHYIVAEYDVESYTDLDTVYRVTLDSEGDYTCTCPDYVHRKAKTGESCKHIRDVMRSRVGLFCRGVFVVK